jgi:hypothetical protein
VKLLLDEMWPFRIAEQLRDRGYDAVAVVERPDLRGQTDYAVFEVAQAEGRTIVTENVSDYRPLATSGVSGGGSHAGVIFTTYRAFPRAEPRTPGRLVTALSELLESGRDATDSELWLA